MTEAKQTKCPHCGSTFRVSDTQLAAKGGNVRCGSCLQVFRADLHMVGAAAPAARPQAAAPAKPKTKAAPDDESWALELLGEEKPKAAPAASPASPVKASSNLEVEDVRAPRKVVREVADEEWQTGRTKVNFEDKEGDGIDDHGFVAESPTGSPTRSLRFDDELSDLLDDAGEGIGGHGEDEDTHIISATADESWAQSILSELEQEEHKQKKKQYSMEVIRDDKPAKAPPKNIKLAAAIGAKVDPEALAAARSTPTPSTPRPAPAPARNPEPAAPARARAPAPSEERDVLSFGDDEDALDFLNEDPSLGAGKSPVSGNTFSLAQPLAHVDAPLVLAPPRRPIDWGRLLTWSFLCLAMIVMFVAQYTFFNFEKLAADVRFRPTIEQACAKFGCYVPDVPDAGRIKVENLVIRPSPQVDGVIQVDAIIHNTASFVQPFPGLRLTFTDRNEQLVATRVFQPSEYLQGDAAMMHRLPPDTPIHISLSLVNPGENAVSYSMEPLF